MGNQKPVLTASDGKIKSGSSVSVSNLFAATDADGDTIQFYSFLDNTSAANSGYFTLDGVKQDAGTNIKVSAGDLGKLHWVSGDAGVTDSLYVTAHRRPRFEPAT